MSSSHFTGRQRKDLSVEMIRTKIAHRKSLSQKENRQKKYQQNRHFGLKDVNIPIMEDRNLEVNKTYQELVPMKPCDHRRQLLQKYKEEKQLQKLKEQREKAKKGVFKVCHVIPDKPSFLSNQKAVKAEHKMVKDVQPSVRITRTKAKEQMEQIKINNATNVRAAPSTRRQMFEKKALDKEKQASQSVVTPMMRMTRSATNSLQSGKQIVKTVSSTTRKPGMRATKEAERKSSNEERTMKKIETKPEKVISFKIGSEENTLDPQTHTPNEIDPDGVLSKMENSPKINTPKMKVKNSFAPKDFMFHPLSGLTTYQVVPMTPRSADAFLTPSYIWTPSEAKVDKIKEATKEILTQECETCSTETVYQDSNKLQSPVDSLPVCGKEHVLNKNENIKNSNGHSTKEVLPLQINEEQVSQPEHDVPYFRNVLQSETEKLTSYCLEWDKKIELDIPDDVKDRIHLAVGQTRLLMKERFKQFEGLVDNCEYKLGEKETSCTDLDGFWDMIHFQIIDVKQKFSDLTKLEECGWQDSNNNKTSRNVRKKVIPKIASQPKKDDSARIAARNRLAAIKNAMREKIKQEERAEVANSIKPKEVDKVVFDAGFFRVESPVKSFSGLSISSESQKIKTPKSASKTVCEGMTKVDLPGQTPPAAISQPAPLDNKKITTECYLLDSSRLSCGNPFAPVERRHQGDSRHISFGGNLITFSPLRPPSREQSEDS